MSMIDTITNAFRERYSAEPDVVALAPGRVNIIGEHTDYTGGFVLPVAIDREVVFAAKADPGKRITGWSVDFAEEASTTTGEWDPKHPSGWFRYVMGVLSELEQTGRPVEGFHFAVGGNVPIGSGLSSSAAIEMATCTAMEGLSGFKLSGKDAALLCQRAENSFVGMNCGIMDQYISRVGEKDHAVLIDCTDLSIRTVPVNTPGYSWLVIDSNKRRGLVGSEYNRRRQECEEGLRIAQQVFAGRTVEGLRDITVADLPALEQTADPTVFRRVKHVVTENDRVLKTVKALGGGKIADIGANLSASHASLRDDFEVSCAELDMLVDILAGVPGVAGSRLTGAGFGGCVIALIAFHAIGEAMAAINKNYRPENLPAGTRAEIWPISLSRGARLIS